MTRRTKQIVRGLAANNDLRIKYVSDLPPTVHGFLDPSKASRTIVVNANKSKSDHVFTILHEIAHFILHFERSHRMRLPWYLTRKWKSERMIQFSKELMQVVLRKLNVEHQADIWAFCALFQIGATDDAQAIVAHDSEKRWTFRLAFASSIYAGIKHRVKRAINGIVHPFTT